MIVNCANIPYCESEIDRKPAVGSDIGYDWGVLHK